MNRLALLVVFAGLGCGGYTPSESETQLKLTVEEWRSLPVERKYDEETLDDLRARNPDLKSEKGWKRFTDEVLEPERAQDLGR